MSRVNWGWLAGFIDGDGCVYVAKGSVRPSACHVSCAQANKDAWILHEIADFLERQGIQCSIYSHAEGRAQFLRITGTVSNLKAMKKLEPHLVIKRSKCQEAIEILGTVFPRRVVKCRRRVAMA